MKYDVFAFGKRRPGRPIEHGGFWHQGNTCRGGDMGSAKEVLNTYYSIIYQYTYTIRISNLYKGRKSIY